MTQTQLRQDAERYHEGLPGLARAALQDHGIGREVIVRRLIGFDGEHITVPVYRADGTIAFLERWSGDAIGTPAEPNTRVELFGAEVLRSAPERVFLAEGIHECLVLESHGLVSVAATGSGRFFKPREWVPLLREVPELFLAYRRGESRERHHFLHTRQEIRAAALETLPNACLLDWPEEVGAEGGAVTFFTTLGNSRQAFEDLIPDELPWSGLSDTHHG